MASDLARMQPKSVTLHCHDNIVRSRFRSTARMVSSATLYEFEVSFHTTQRSQVLRNLSLKNTIHERLQPSLPTHRSK